MISSSTKPNGLLQIVGILIAWNCLACATVDQSSKCRSVQYVRPDSAPVESYWPENTFVQPPPGADADAEGMIRYVDAFSAVHLSTELCAMEEPRLRELDADEIYRVIWLRSFDSPIAVRVSRTGERHSLVAIRLSGPIGSEVPRTIAEREVRSITEKEWRQAVNAIDRSGFETMSPTPPLPTSPDEESTHTMDGSGWVIEGMRGQAYRIVVRSDPGQTGELAAFRAAAVYFLELSHLELGEIY